MTTKPTEPAKATGTVHGRVITLDVAVPELDGRRVRILLGPVDEPDLSLDARQNALLWQEWVERGEHGPLDKEDAGFP
jgi:hypothetical protein